MMRCRTQRTQVHRWIARRNRRGESNNTVIIVVCVVGGLCLVLCVPGLLIALLLPAVQQAREAARRTQSQNNLKQVGLAMYNFSDTKGQWPGPTTDEQGSSMHSWQTHLLPFIDQQALYSAIDLEKPWNVSVNDGTFRLPIEVYLHPSEPERVTADGYAASHYSANQNLSLPNHQLSISDVTDGTANTIAAGEISSNIPAWGDPANVRDPAAGINQGGFGFGSRSPGGCHFLLMDGSVRFVMDTIDPGVLKALSTPTGGETINSF